MALPAYNQGYTEIPFVPCRVGRIAGGVMDTQVGFSHADINDWRSRCAEANAKKTTTYTFPGKSSVSDVSSSESESESEEEEDEKDVQEHNREARVEIAAATEAENKASFSTRRRLDAKEGERVRSSARGEQIRARQKAIAELQKEKLEFSNSEAKSAAAATGGGKKKSSARSSTSKSKAAAPSKTKKKSVRPKKPILAKPKEMAKDHKKGALARASDGTWYKNILEKTGGLRWRPLSVADKIKYHNFIKRVPKRS